MHSTYQAAQEAAAVGGVAFYFVVFCIGCFIAIYGIALVRTLGHILAVLFRKLRGRPAKLDPWTLSYLLPAAIVVGAFYLVDTYVMALNETPLLEAWAIFIMAIMAVLLPVLMPIARAFTLKRFYATTYIFAVTAVFAMPVAMSFLTMSLTALQASETGGSPSAVGVYFTEQGYSQDCAAVLSGALRLPEAQNDEINKLIWFWIDATIKAVFLDAFEVYGCSVSAITHNTASQLMSSLVFAYRTFAAAVVLAILLAPFRGRTAREA